MQYFMLPAALMTASGMLANAAPLKNGNKDVSSDLRPMVSPSTRAGEQLVVQWQPAAKDTAWKHMDVTLVALSEDGSQHETNLAHGIDGTDPNNNVLRAKAPEHVSGDNAEYLIKFSDGQDEKKSSKFVIRGSAKQKRHGQSSSDAPMSMDQNKMGSIIQHMLSSGGDASSLFQSQNKTSSHGHGQQTGQGRSAMAELSESNDDNGDEDEAEADDGSSSSSSSSSASSSPSTSSSTKSSASSTSSNGASSPSPTMIDGVMYFPLVSSKVPKEVMDDIKSQQSGTSSSTSKKHSKKQSKSAEPTSKPESRDAWSDIAQNMEAQQAQKAHKKIHSSSSGKKHSHKSSSSSNSSTDIARNAAAKIPTASPSSSSSSSSSSKKQGHGHKSSSSSSSASSNKHGHKNSSSSSKKHSSKPSSSSSSNSSSSSTSQPAESTGAPSSNNAAAAPSGGANSSNGGDDQSAQNGSQGGDQGGQGGELQVDTPPFAAQCKPLRITWHGGKGPYTPHITAEGDVSNVLTTLDETSDTSVPGWKVNVPEGQKFTINLCDSDGQCKPSGPVGPVGQGSDDCMGGAGGPPQKRSASENAGGSATGSWSSPTDSEGKAKSSSHSKGKKSSSRSSSRSTSKKGGRSSRSGNHNSRSSNLVPLSSVMNQANNDRASSSVSLFLGMNPVAGLESLFDSSASSRGSTANSRSSSRPSRSSASVTNSRATPTSHHRNSQGSQSASQGSSQDIVGQLTRSIDREGSNGENSSMIDMLAQGIMGDSGLSPNQVSEYFRSSGRRTSDHQRHGQMSMTVDYRHGTQSVSMSS